MFNSAQIWLLINGPEAIPLQHINLVLKVAVVYQIQHARQMIQIFYLFVRLMIANMSIDWNLLQTLWKGLGMKARFLLRETKRASVSVQGTGTKLTSQKTGFAK